MNDQEQCLHWLRQIARGDQDALAHIQRAFIPRLWRYLRLQLGGDVSWVEDVLQDIFLAVWQSAHTYQGEAHAVATWIFRIAHHHAANARRSQFRRPEGHPAILLEDHAVVLLEDEVVQRVVLTEALHRLGPKYQEVLYLVFYQGFRQDEVAQILTIPLGTVKSRLNHARRLLLAELAATGAEVSPHEGT